MFVNLMMREQTLISGFAARFCFVKLTLGVMPISTRRSRASTFQIISPRLSENGTMVTFAFDTSFSSTHFNPVTWMAQKVWRHCGLVFVHDLGYRGGNSKGTLSNMGLLLSTGNIFLFLFQYHLSTVDS